MHHEASLIRCAWCRIGRLSRTPSVESLGVEVEDNAEEERNVPMTQSADHATPPPFPGRPPTRRR